MHCNGVAGFGMASPDLDIAPGGSVACSTAAALGFVPPKRGVAFGPSGPLALNQRSSWPDLFRPSTPCFVAKAWMPATSAGMTVESEVRKFRHRDFLHVFC